MDSFITFDFNWFGNIYIQYLFSNAGKESLFV